MAKLLAISAMTKHNELMCLYGDSLHLTEGFIYFHPSPLGQERGNEKDFVHLESQTAQ